MPAVPPKLRGRDHWPAILISGVMVVCIGVVVFFFDPVKSHFYPICLFHKYTGLECPGCGSTRALYALLHGNFSAAVHDNALLVSLMVLFAIRGGWLALRQIRGQGGRSFFPSQWFWPLLAVALLFGVLRNLPWFSFLSPD